MVYYGETSVVIEVNNGSFFLTSFQLPFFTISGPTEINSVVKSVECTGTTYVVNLTVIPTNFRFPMAVILPK